MRFVPNLKTHLICRDYGASRIKKTVVLSVEVLNGKISHSFISNGVHGHTNNSCTTCHIKTGTYLQLKLYSSFLLFTQ